MNKKLLFPLALLLAFSLSCGKKEDTQEVNPCVEDILTPFPPATCSDITHTDYFCEVEFLGKYQLEESSKLFQPQYCESVGNKITYKNENGVSLFVDPKPYKYYFNKEIGLIGFVDSSGVLWVIES